MANSPDHPRTTNGTAEAVYRALVERAIVGICRVRADGWILTANPAFAGMLGHGSAADIADLLPLFVEPSEGAAFLDEYRATEGPIARDVLWRRKDGEHIRVRLKGRAADDGTSGRVYEFIAEDVTEAHRIQQTQKMEAVGQLAGGIAHDFNNVLTSILGYSELLTDQIGPDKAIGRDLREIRVAAERAAALTQQLLAFSRKQVMALAPTDLSDMVRQFEPMLRRLMPESIRIEYVLRDDLDPVMVDVSQVERLLIGFATNARDAMTAGGTLTVTTSNQILSREFVVAHPGSAEGAFGAVAVRDTGIGMALDVRRRVFEPFFSTKERYRGAGLGLAAAYGTVKQMGGYIGVESAPGLGTTFTTYFPVSEAAVKARTARPAAPEAETVLLVEDETSVREFTKAALQRSGYRVIEADSAEAALRLLDVLDRTIDLLLTDVVLPGLDGRELARRLQARRPVTRVLFMSGYATALRTEDGFRIPGVQLLEKPFTAQALLAMTRQMLASPPDA